MKKNIVIIINPMSKNIMKAIYNALIINLIEIIIIGDRKIIYSLCIELNLNIEILQIVDVLEIKDINIKIEEYKKIKEIKGIIIDDCKNGNIIKEIKTNYICNLVDFGVFLKSVYIVNSNKYESNIENIINITKGLNILNNNIGIVMGEKSRTIELKKKLRKKMIANKVDIIYQKRISKCKYNIILFESRLMERQYLNLLKEKVLVRNIEINKASNIYIFDAKNKSLNSIFLQLLFLSKIQDASDEVNTKIV